MKHKMIFSAVFVAFFCNVAWADESHEARMDAEIQKEKISKKINAANIATNKAAIAAIQLTPGPAGPQGTAGADSTVPGPQGPIGLTGAAGANGVDGATGPQGPIGLTGAAGANGVDGATGAQGPIGLTGAAGADGTPGMDGAPGLDGAQGIDGLDGLDGMPGSAGPTGPAGADGATGLAGSQGPQGLPGKDGLFTKAHEDAICALYAGSRILPPAFCAPATPAKKIIFVTSALYNGNLGGVTGADRICQKHASSAGLPGTFKAWISDGLRNSPSSWVSDARPYYNAAGTTLIANDFNGLTSGTLLSGISQDEFGASVISSGVWTNTLPGGTAFGQDCGAWTNGTNSAAATMGSSGRVNGSWTFNATNQQCSGGARLYCVSQ